MRFFPSQRQRLFLRRELWRNGRPTPAVGWLALGGAMALAGLVAASSSALLLGIGLGGMGVVIFSANWMFALVFGELRLKRDVHTRVDAFLKAVTQATYPYDGTTFPMQIYLLHEGSDGTVTVSTDDPWWAGPTRSNTTDTRAEPLHPAPAWVSQAVDALTLVDGVRVLPTLVRLTTFADRSRPKPTMHQILALRAEVLAHTPPGVAPDWT
jgi:hypothetical protein